MRKSLIFFTIIALGSLSANAYAQDVRSILETSQEKQLQRWKGVDAYVVDQSIAGQKSQTVFQRTEVTDSAGNRQTMFLPVRNAAAQVGQCEGTRSMTADELEIFAQGLELTGSAVGTRQDEQLAEAGIPAGLMKGDPSEPWASPDPRIMLGAGATFMRGAAEAKRAQDAEDPSADGRERADQIAQFIEEAQLVGTESIEGRSAFHLRASDLNDVQESDGSEFRTQTMSMWIDSEEYVPLRIKMDGTMTSGKETKPMSMELIHADYRRVPDSDMYESHKQITRISGMLDDEQMQQMREAQEKMAVFEQQMASMPADQRAMMERMVGPQLEQFKKMAASGGFESEIITHSITVNPPITGPGGQACSAESAAALPGKDEPSASLEDWETNLAVVIQQNLRKLGYTPGNTDGVMDKLTVVAISKFQAEKNLEVTGRPSPQLAGILTAAVDALNPESN